jgi:hypothetical protein
VRETKFYYRSPGGADRCTRPGCPDAGDSLALDEVIRAHLVRVLDMADGKISGPGGAAELLRVNASTLRSKLDRLGVPYGRRTRRPAPVDES